MAGSTVGELEVVSKWRRPGVFVLSVYDQSIDALLGHEFARSGPTAEI